MENYPIQLVMNASDYVKDEVRPPGGSPPRDYYAGRDEQFRAHKVRFAEQLDQFSAAQLVNPYTRIAYAKVVLERKAIAKSNRPTGKMITEKNGCKVVGGSRKGEMLVRFSPSSTEKLKEALGKAEDTVQMVTDKKTGEEVVKTSAWRSEVGAIKDVLPFSAQDRCSITADDIVASIENEGNGMLYMELFENTLDKDLMGTDDEMEQRKMFKTLSAGLREIPGVRVFHSSLRAARRSYVVYMVTSRDSVVNMGEDVLSAGVGKEELSKDVKDYDVLLDFLTTHPVVKQISISPVVHSMGSPGFHFDGTEEAEIPTPENLDKYPLIGVADSGIAHALEEWVAARVDNINPKYKDDGHGTFIGGLYIIGKRLNPTFITERDGNRLVDICVMPDEDHFSDVYHFGFEEFADNLRNSIREVVEQTGVRVIVFSNNARCSRPNDCYTEMAKVLDTIATELNVIFVISAGNLYGKEVHREWSTDDAEANIVEFTSRKDDIVRSPAESISNLSIGALNPPENLGIANYSCIGKGLASGTKPDMVHVGGFGKKVSGKGYGMYSIVGDGTIVTSSGTSFSAPIVAKTLAALDYQIEGNVPRETLMALAIHSSTVPEPFQDKKYKPYLMDWIGFGKPSDSEAILNGDEHKISLVFHHAIRKGQVYSFPFNWPKSLVEDGLCKGRVKLTVVSTPQVDYDYGEEFVREEVRLSLVQMKNGKRTSNQSQVKPIYYMTKPKAKAQEVQVHLNEEELRKEWYKWNPVKVYEREFAKGVPVDGGVWYLEARYSDRENVVQSAGGLEFTVIMTIEDPKGDAAVYHEMRQELKAAGVRIDDIQTALRIKPRV